MQLTLGQAALRDLLVAVKPFISGRSPNPVLNNYLLGVKDGVFSVLGNDMEISMTTGTSVLGSRDGRVTVPAKQMLDIVQKLPADGVTITSDNGIDTMITCRRSKFNLRGVRAEDYIMPPAAEDGAPLTLDAKLIGEILHRTLYAARNGADILAGCWMRVKDNRLEFAAIDGFRMAYWKQDLDDDAADFERVIPSRSLLELAKLAKNADGPIQIREAGSSLAIELPGTYMTTRVLDGAYPGFQAIIPPSSSYTQRIVLDRESFIEAIERVGVMASEMEHDLVALSFNGNELTVTASRNEQGGGEDVVACSQASEPFAFAAKAGYLAEALRSIGTQDVEVCYVGKHSPITLLVPDDDRLTTIIMPFNVES